MFRYLFFIFILMYSFNAYPNENLLTIQQQVERLQREVTDLSKTIFSNKTNNNSIDSDVVTNLSAIDMRIYDLEKDVKNITADFEEIIFQIDDIILKLNEFENIILSLETNLSQFKNNNLIKNTEEEQADSNKNNNENTLGTLKINSDSQASQTNLENEDSTQNLESTQDLKLSPEEQFQLAFDNIRNKNWDDAKNSLIKFIEDHPKNQLAGSAHYWLGELYILEKKYRDAALFFAEGYQKFPESLKASDMLFKLSQSLYEVGKVEDSCKTLDKLKNDYPKNRFKKEIKKLSIDYGCS